MTRRTLAVLAVLLLAASVAACGDDDEGDAVADTVTEMRTVKHAYDSGPMAPKSLDH